MQGFQQFVGVDVQLPPFSWFGVRRGTVLFAAHTSSVQDAMHELLRKPTKRNIFLIGYNGWEVQILLNALSNGWIGVKGLTKEDKQLSLRVPVDSFSQWNIAWRMSNCSHMLSSR